MKSPRWLEVQALAVALLISSSALADGFVRFDIPSQRADAALTAFARQAEIPILFPFDEVSLRTANRLVGEYTVEDGLKVLLDGTGLTATVNGTGQLTVQISEPPLEQNRPVVATQPRSASIARAELSEPAMLEEIVITARRREESLLELPLSIQAITAAQMEVGGIYSIEDITNFVPNVTLMVTGRSNLGSVIIRGIGGGSPEPAIIYGSAMYLDGHYMPARQNGFMSTLDIERVEVLRGPQGTLFGKNVTGGLVNIVTAKPGPEFDASVTVRVADHGQQDMRGIVNHPISDHIFGRVAFSSEKMDGYYFNHHLNIDAGATDLQAFNGALRFELGESWTLDFSANRQRRDDQNRAYQCNPQDGSAPRWGGDIGHLNRIYDGYEADLRTACAIDSAAGLFVTSSDHVTFSTLEVDSVFATAQWNSNGALGELDEATFKLQMSWQDTDFRYYLDRDHSFYPIGEMGHPRDVEGCNDDYCGQPSTTRGWEALFKGQVSDRLSFTAGINYFWELHKIGDGKCRQRFIGSGAGDLDPVNPTVAAPDGGVLPNPATGDITTGVDCNDAKSGLVVAPLLGGPQPFILQVRGENESLGVFGHLTHALNDDWLLDLGTRWTRDDREYWNFENEIEGCVSVDDPQQRSLGDVTATPDLHCSFTYAPSFESALINGFHNEFADSWSETTSMISLTRKLEGDGVLDSGIVYVLYSEGFLSGGFNTEINSNLPELAESGFAAFGPERVANYEMGFKGTFFDSHLQLAADAFLMDYTDKQENIEVPNEGGVFGPDEGSPLDIRTNVASARISGIELELRASPWDGGTVSAALGILDSEYSSYQYPDPINPGTIVDQSNTTLQNRIPQWTLTVGAGHEFTLANGASITPRIQLYTQDSYDYQANVVGAPSSPFCTQDAYTKVDTRITYVPASGDWRASLFGHNITDEAVLGTCDSQHGVYNYWHHRPAWWGLEFTRDWGAN